jgi:hypothetical protein
MQSDDLDRLAEQILDYVVPVREPLVLISQIQRSGGTLLSQLLDGHPELHAHPHELHVGHPKKDNWPEVDLEAEPKRQFKVLAERSHSRLFEDGYRKRMPEHAQHDEETFPFLQPPSLVVSLFRRIVPQGPEKAREVLDAYFTAYFNAWLDNRHLRDGPKRWIAAFTPRLAWGDSRRRYFADYPDGRLIAILRDPHDWFASAREHHPRYADCEESIAQWVEGAREMAAAHKERPEVTLVLRFEDLVLNTESVMRGVADWLGIGYAESLLSPTFNDMPIQADSSFAVSEHGVLRDAVGRGRDLPPDDAALIDRVGREPYKRALATAWRP